MTSFTRIKNGSSAELIACRKNRIISLIILSFAGLIYAFGASVSVSRREVVPVPTSFNSSGLALFMFFASYLCLFSACTSSFKDMHDRPSADVQMSMPLSSTERYISRLLTICRIWLFPFLAAYIGGTAIAALIHAGEAPGAAALVFTESGKYLVWMMAAALFIMSVTVLCQCCTGSKAESKYTPVLLMFVFSLAPVLMYELSDKFGSIVCGRETPVYFIWSFSELFAFFDSDKEDFVLFGLINCMISLVLLFGVMYLYKKRDARSVGMPVCYPLFLEVTVFLSLMMLFSIVHSSSFEGMTFFLAWLGSIILRIITARKSFSIKKVGIWSLLFIAYYAVFLIIMYIFCITGNFGALYRKADLKPYEQSSVRVAINIRENYRWEHYIWSDDYYSHDRETMIDTDFRYYLSGSNTEQTEQLMKICSKYAKVSSGRSGLFTSEMFGAGRAGYYCNLRITSSVDHSWESVYSINFVLPREDAADMTRELTECASRINKIQDNNWATEEYFY